MCGHFGNDCSGVGGTEIVSCRDEDTVKRSTYSRLRISCGNFSVSLLCSSLFKNSIGHVRG